MNLQRRIEIETLIINKTIDTLLSAGFALGVNDGEMTTIKNSTDREAIIKSVMTTDEDYLLTYRDGKQCSWVYFVYGNDGWDVINDYDVSLEHVLAPVVEYCSDLEMMSS